MCNEISSSRGESVLNDESIIPTILPFTSLTNVLKPISSMNPDICSAVRSLSLYETLASLFSKLTFSSFIPDFSDRTSAIEKEEITWLIRSVGLRNMLLTSDSFNARHTGHSINVYTASASGRL